MSIFKQRSTSIVDWVSHKCVFLNRLEEWEGYYAECSSWVFLGSSWDGPTQMAHLGLRQQRGWRVVYVLGLLSQVPTQNVNSRVLCENEAVEFLSSTLALFKGQPPSTKYDSKNERLIFRAQACRHYFALHAKSLWWSVLHNNKLYSNGTSAIACKAWSH